MTLSSGIYPDLSVAELALAAEAKSDQRRLRWQMFGWFALIAATVGIATEAARWAR